MTKKINVHVTKHADCGWQVLEEGNKKPIATATTQAEAIKKGREVAKKLESELVIHGVDGKIRDKDSYGNDPKTIRDKKY